MAVSAPGALDGRRHRLLRRCWGLRPGRPQRQQQLRQRQQRRWGPAEILLSTLLS